MQKTLVRNHMVSDEKKEMDAQLVADLDLGSMVELAIVVLIITVIVIFGGAFTEDLRTDLPTQYCYNGSFSADDPINRTTCNVPAVEKALNDSQVAFFKIPTKLKIIVSAVLFAIVIAIIVKYIWNVNNEAKGGGGI